MDFLKTLRSAAGHVVGEVLELHHPGASGKVILAALKALT